MNKKQEKSVSIRFPVDLLQEMKRHAKNENRSMNGEVIQACRKHVRPEQSGKEEPSGG